MRRPRLIGVSIVVAGILLLGLVGLIVNILWNVLMPAILGLPAIGFWQALGLLLLSRLLFGGFGGWGRRIRKARFVRGWNDLTPEERQRFRNAMGRSCPRNFGEDEAAQKV